MRSGFGGDDRMWSRRQYEYVERQLEREQGYPDTDRLGVDANSGPADEHKHRQHG
jgi:hypothetical protein